MDKIYFVAFASTDMKYALKRIGRQARRFRLFAKIFLYTEKNLPEYAKQRCADIIAATGVRRGYAYWSWKPVIINQVLNKIDEGDVVVYSDAGSHMNLNGKRKLLDYIQMAKDNDIWVIQFPPAGYTELNWTKRDTLEYFKSNIADKNALDDFNRRIYEGQIEGGTVIAVKNAYVQSIMKRWEEYMSLPNLHLFDDSPSALLESADFHENRHDQSILSLLLKSHHYAATGAEHFYPRTTGGGGGWEAIKETEPFLRLRDRYSKPISVYARIRKMLGKIKRWLKKALRR